MAQYALAPGVDPAALIGVLVLRAAQGVYRAAPVSGRTDGGSRRFPLDKPQASEEAPHEQLGTALGGMPLLDGPLRTRGRGRGPGCPEGETEEDQDDCAAKDSHDGFLSG